MEPVLANTSVSITELKKNPSSLIEKSEGEPIVILNHNRPTAYLIPARTYEDMLEKLDDYYLGLIIEERESEMSQAIEMKIEDL